MRKRRLEGVRIAIAGPRKSEEISVIIGKLGGAAPFRPAQGTVFPTFESAENEVKKLINDPVNWVIFTTGMGVEAIWSAAVQSSLQPKLLQVLRSVRIAARGYKTVNALKKLGLAPEVCDDDGSNAGLIRALTTRDLHGKRIALQLHGDPSPALVNFLQEREVDFWELLPYRHVPPDPEVMHVLLSEIVGGQVDAVAFTSSPQVRFLTSYAKEQGLHSELCRALEQDVIAMAVGKVTASVLRDEGIGRIVVPEQERMGSMIVALADFYQRQHMLKGVL